MADLIAENILAAIINYTEARDIRKKISWLRTANVLLMKALEKRSENNTKPNPLIDQAKECYAQLELIGLYNWEVFEKYRSGSFDLIDDEEYRNALKILNQLEKTKDKLLALVVEAGYTETRLPVV